MARAAGLALAALLAACGAPPQRAALLIGVGRYAAPALSPLAGPPADVQAVRALLTRRYGFDPAHITTLTDAQATRAGVLAGLTALGERAAPGAQLVVHFSGHGSQVFDRSGDEPDGWDESLVLYDSDRAGDDAHDLLDDELGAFVARWAAAGAAVTVILDSCHAGTGLRAGGVRAAPPSGPVVGDGPAPVGGAVSDLGDGGAPYVLVTAARAGQLAREVELADGRTHGALTWALLRALQAAPRTATWQQVVARAGFDVAAVFPAQHPQLEGAGRAGRPFAGALGAPSEWVVVQPDGARAVVPLGQVHGVGVGARLATRGADGRDGPPLVLDTVTLTQASGPAPAGLVAGWTARVVAHGATPEPLRVRAADPAVQAALAAWPQLAVDAAGAIEVRAVPGGFGVFAGDVPRGPTAPSVAAVVTQVLGWARWHALRRLASDDSLPVAAELTPAGPVPSGAERTLVVRNDSARRLYLNVLALSADGAVEVLFPTPGAIEQIEAGRTWQAALRFTTGAAETHDLLQVVFTPVPADFGPVTQPPVRDGAVPRAFGTHPVGRWIAANALGVRAGGGPEALPRDDWAVRGVPVFVQPRESSATDGVKRP